MAGIGILFIVVILQIGLSFAGARFLADRGLGIAFLPFLALPVGILLLAVALTLGPDGLSEGFARAAPLLAAGLLALVVIGAVAAGVAIRLRK
jgi:hypothetical protein